MENKILKRQTVFLTGATGLLGSYLLKILLENANKVYVLGRAKGENGAHKRVLDMLRFWDENIIDKSYLKQLVVIEGDIIYPDFGVKSGYDRERLFSEVEIIFHSAALAELRSPLELIRKINVEGTKNVLEFSSQCRKSGRPIKVNHISTAYVVGNKKGIDFSEDMLELGQGFYNTYEQTKYEAELLVRQYIKNGLDISIFRPSMIMGSTEEGKTNNFRLFYEPLHFFSKKIYNEFPASANCFQNLINIDTVAKALFLLREEKGSNTYHIVSSQNTTIGFFLELAAEYFSFKMPVCIPQENFNFAKWTPVQKTLAEPFIPYFNYNTKFSSIYTQSKLSEYGFYFPCVDRLNLVKILEYCHKSGFIKIRKNGHV